MRQKDIPLSGYLSPTKKTIRLKAYANFEQEITERTEILTSDNCIGPCQIAASSIRSGQNQPACSVRDFPLVEID
jgi:hypothetical protein